MLNRWIVWLVELRARHEGEVEGAQRREVRWVVDDLESARPEARSYHIIEIVLAHALEVHRKCSQPARAKSASDFFSSTLNI